jgi:hypothetical protein
MRRRGVTRQNGKRERMPINKTSWYRCITTAYVMVAPAKGQPKRKYKLEPGNIHPGTWPPVAKFPNDFEELVDENAPKQKQAAAKKASK